jgi:hypothetical protein
MQVREAKDFLVQETAKQASIEGVPLSELEKRMMYFVENEEMGEDPLALNDEFEAAYDTDEYEAKISGLLHRAYARVREENPDGGKFWMAALKELCHGDHYLPVLWGSPVPGYRVPRQARPPHDFLKLVGAALFVTALLAAVIFAIGTFAQHRMPVRVQRLLIFGLAAGYIYFAVLPLILKKSPPGVGALWSRLFRNGSRENRNEREGLP